jgi:cellulose synthase/poly-beta-1,6-N-acetylglucosamine synthase-like glycosyltransferase
MHLDDLAIALFFLSGGVLAYTFFGYGVFIGWLAKRRARPLSSPRENAILPSVCVIVAARNEETRIAARVQNLLASDYPPEKLRVILVSDGSTDATVATAESLTHLRLSVLTRPDRHGKAAALNFALPHATEEVIVFTDVRQDFTPGAIARLAAHFGDPEIGAVSGSLEIAPAASATGSGVDFYWRQEKTLRANESHYDSCIGCTGAIYAIRRELFAPIPEDTLRDDVVIPMQIALRGQRIIHDPEAHAFDPQPLEPAAERRRKQRTIAGNFQMLFRHPAWLSPTRNRLWWQLLSHKYLRLAAPLFLAVAFITNAALITHPFYAACFAGQVLFYLAALLGSAGVRARWASLPAAFVFLNLMTLRGLAYYLARRSRPGWE